jgi:hypothetical protein
VIEKDQVADINVGWLPALKVKGQADYARAGSQLAFQVWADALDKGWCQVEKNYVGVPQVCLEEIPSPDRHALDDTVQQGPQPRGRAVHGLDLDTYRTSTKLACCNHQCSPVS